MEIQGQDCKNTGKFLFLRLDEGILFGLLALQIVMIAYFNLRDIRNSLDSDFANTIYHFREVIRKGTLILPDWNYTTSMELDAVFLFALPIYYIVRDIFTAVGISNLIFVLLYIVTVTGILRNVNVSRKYILITLCLILTPYSFGMLEYFNMMFYGGSCYSLKTLVPLLCIWVLLLFDKQKCFAQGKNSSVGGISALSVFIVYYILFHRNLCDALRNYSSMLLCIV